MPKISPLQHCARALATACALTVLLSSTSSCQDSKSATETDTASVTLRDIGNIVVNGREIRKPPLPTRRQGRVDVEKTLARVKLAGADAFVFHIGNGDHDWDDFKLLAQGADKQGVKLWGAFRLPVHRANSMPFQGNFEKWCSSIAELAKKHPSIVAILLPQLEQGRNPKFVHLHRCAALRNLAHEGGISLIASVFDPESEWIALYKNSIDGIMLRWTKFNNILNLSGMLSGVAAMCPKRWKRIICFEGRAYFGASKPIDAEGLGIQLQIAMRRAHGVAVHLLDLENPSKVDPLRSGDSAQWKAVQAFSTRWRERSKRKR